MRKNLFFALLLSLACVSCTPNKSIFNGRLVEIKKFDYTSKIIGKKLFLTDPPQGIIGIHKMDSLIMFKYNSRRTDYLLALYDVKNDQFLGNLLRIGRGPDEFLSIDYWGEYSIDYDDDRHIYFSAINEKAILKCNVSDFVRSGTYTTEKLHTFPAFSMNTHVLNDTCFLSYFHDIDRQQMLYRKFYSTNGNYTDYALYNIKIPTPNDFGFLWSAEYLKPSKDKLALAMDSFCLINILDFNNPNNNLSIIPDRSLYEDFETLSNKAPQERLITYVNLKCTDQYIFALYSGHIPGKRDQVSGVELHVVDWKGRGIARLFIDEILMALYIDESCKTMYAFDHLEQLYTYDLSEII